jgi:hypothetical protein
MAAASRSREDLYLAWAERLLKAAVKNEAIARRQRQDALQLQSAYAEHQRRRYALKAAKDEKASA